MKPCRRERGASLAESALVLSVVLALLFGVIEFGRAMYSYAFVAQLAREGARWATVRGSQCTLLDNCNAGLPQVQSYVRSLAEGPTASTAITATPTWGNCPSGSSANAPGCTVSVTVRYPFTFVALGFLPKGTFTMSSTSQMVISQ